MKFYIINISNELEEKYNLIAEELDISMEQVLSEAVQLYAEHLTLEKFSNATQYKL